MNQLALQQMLLNQLKQKNPQGYNQIISMMNSGQSPQDILNNMRANGSVSQEQINQAQNYLNNMNSQNRKTF